MSIDPRTLSAMLKLQLAPSLDFTSSSAGVLGTETDSSGSSIFDMLLNQYMDGSLGETAALNNDMAISLSSAALASLPLPLSDSYDSSSSSPSGLSGLSYSGSSDYSSMIEAAAAKYGLDPALVESVVKTESGFNPNAQSSAGAKGLMQLMDSTARSLGVTDSFDPQQNIDAGSRYLSYLMRKYNNNEQVALAAYNAGPGTVDRLGISTNEELQEKLGTLPEETRNYITKVLNA